MAASMLTDLAMAMSYEDVMTLLKYSPRLRASFDVEAFKATYLPSEALPETLFMPLVNYAMAPLKAFWRGSTDTGDFTLETPDRSYVLHGHIYSGELAGKITVITDDVVVHGMFSRGVPDGVWHTDHAYANTLLSKETYVDGLRQGVSVYYYDLSQGIPKDGGSSTKRYEMDFVNNEPVAWRLFRPDGSIDRSGQVAAGVMV